MRIVYYIAIVLVLLARFHLALTRAFDPDEFAHLHWTWLLTNGYLPYRDFFFYIMPGFQWLLAPILWVTGDSPDFLITSRIAIWLVYGAGAWIVYRLSKKSLLATLIFLTFPVTIDKTVDVRPDMVMLLLYFASFMVKNPLLSGVLFGMSVLVLPKIIFALPALLYWKRSKLWWFVGAGLVALGFLGYLRINNLMPQFLTSIMRDSFAVTSGKMGFSPLLLFTPFPLIYLTRGGITLPWVVNTLVWVAAITGLSVLVKKREPLGIFWLLFVLGNVLFVFVFPAPYVQYFLPLSVAASVLSTRAVGRNITVITIITVIIVLSFFLQYQDRTQPGAENSEQLEVIRHILTVVRPNETVYDMVGSYVFRPDGYYICCHPYGEFVSKLKTPPPPLREFIITRQTKFLVMDRVGFVFWQTPEPDLTFLKSNYLASNYHKLYSLGQQFRCQNGACVQYLMDNKPASNRSTNTLTVVVAQSYRISVIPQSASVSLDGNAYTDNDVLGLASGAHRISAAWDVTSFRIQLNR